MPDLKSEMSKVLEAWEKDVDQLQQQKEKQVQTQQLFKPSNNVTRETFNYVRDNPLKTHREVCDALEPFGFSPNSVGSLLTQFVKQNQLARDHLRRYTALAPEYKPPKSSKKFKAEGKRVNKIVSIKSKVKPKAETKSTGIAALKVDTTSKIGTQWDADTIINNIGLKQARALYDELKTIFGG